MSAVARARRRLAGRDWPRVLALVAVAGSLGASLQVLYRFIEVAGVPLRFLALVAVTLVAATALARRIEPRVAVGVAVALLVAGLAWYLTHLVGSPSFLSLLGDTFSLIAGRSLLRISNINAWVLGVSPAPVFLTWYFAVRQRYVPAVAVSGGTLLFFVLTGDADAVTTLTGVVAGAAAVGIGDFDLREESAVAAEPLVVLVAVMILVPWVVSVVPTAAAVTVPSLDVFGHDNTLETSLMTADDQIQIQGSITLSPAVRYTVDSTEGRYWRVAAYDRYTGDGWVQTGGTSDYGGGELQRPPGPTRTVRQTFTAESTIDTMPAAWRPVRVSGIGGVRQAAHGGFQPGHPLDAGQTYAVESAVVSATPDQLQNAGTDYPSRLSQRYTQLPDSVPDRVARRTDRLTANAETPYETALTVERWLRNNRNYSLQVDRPDGNIADAFLFDMDQGYCTYYATTMVTMLRTQGIPARFVVGYTPGQRVGQDQWVVRGYNSHAWVEVYFPDVGWVQFDPTPSQPRQATEQARLQQARQRNASGVDTGGSAGGEWTPSPTPTPEPLNPANGSYGNGTTPVQGFRTPPGGVISDVGINGSRNATLRDLVPDAPSRQELLLAAVALVGIAIAVRRTGYGERLYRAVWLRYQLRIDPETDVERAFERLLYHLEENSYRTRKPTDTAREFLEKFDADEEVSRVAAIRERARYAGQVTQDEADEAVRLVDRIVR